MFSYAFFLFRQYNVFAIFLFFFIQTMNCNKLSVIAFNKDSCVYKNFRNYLKTLKVLRFMDYDADIKSSILTAIR